jgi:hypothetical protein
MTLMTRRAATSAEASTTAAELRAVFRGTDWAVRIVRPLFDGDDYRVEVV